MDLYEQAGPLTLGSRLRAMTAGLTEEAARVFDLYGVGLDPRWFPVFYMLAQAGPLAVTEMAHAIGHSHASVSQIARAMQARGLIRVRRSSADRRIRQLALTSAGRRLARRLEPQLEDVRSTMEELFQGMEHDLWAALDEFGALLSERSLYERVRDRFRLREAERIRIDDFTDADGGAFQRLNLAWIEEHFEVEEADRRTLDDPRGTILDPGGHILMARFDGEPVGTCALVPLDDGDGFELAKMAVAGSMRGRGLGERLGRAAVERARACGASRIYLESNTRLEPAITLYEKLGFRRIRGRRSPYARCNIHMELRLERTPG